MRWSNSGLRSLEHERVHQGGMEGRMRKEKEEECCKSDKTGSERESRHGKGKPQIGEEAVFHKRSEVDRNGNKDGGL